MIRRFLSRWRRRGPRPLPPQPEAERDWAEGDLAQCIAGDRPWVTRLDHSLARGPTRGQVLRVAVVYLDEGVLWLVFREFGRNSFPAGHFRKLRACSSDFCAKLRAPAPAERPKVAA